VGIACACLAIPSGATGQSPVEVGYKGPDGPVLHEPIVVEFSIQNASQESIGVDLGDDSKANFVIEIRKPDGVLFQAPPLPEHDGLHRRGRIPIPSRGRYDQKMVLNEWYSFDQPGSYEVTIQLRTRIVTGSGRSIDTMTTGVLTFGVAPRNEQLLQQACQRLAEITLNAIDANESIDAAHALSYVDDPIGVEWMAWVLERTDRSDAAMIRGLTRIGDVAAHAVLARAAASGDPVRSAMARNELGRLASKRR
jgi:hypothetical protein